MRRFELFTICSDESLLKRFIETNGGSISRQCDVCGTDIKLNISRLYFRCWKTLPSGRCSYKAPFFASPHPFSFSKLNLKTILFLLYEYSTNTKIIDVAYEYNLALSTVSETFKKFRSILVIHYIMNEPQQIGGPGIIVEWDESLLVKHKNHEGRILQGQRWYFGGVVRGASTRCFIEHVEQRDAITLAEVVARRVLPGSIINCDGWRAYEGIRELLPEYELIYERVNHRENFIDPLTGANTQSIEAFWSVLKREMRKKGTNHGTHEHRDMLIQEILAKRIYGRQVFTIILMRILN